MSSLNIIRPNFLFIYLLILSIFILSINSQKTKLKSVDYRRVTKLCGIRDYFAWVQRQQEFVMWLDLAKMLRLSFDEDPEFQRELKQYRLQYECLRLVERLPLSIGPG